jgi:hypothetical protein
MAMVRDWQSVTGAKTAAAEWVNPLKGRARALGSKLTYDRFMDMQEAALPTE